MLMFLQDAVATSTASNRSKGATIWPIISFPLAPGSLVTTNGGSHMQNPTKKHVVELGE